LIVEEDDFDIIAHPGTEGSLKGFENSPNTGNHLK
jgi:hypothetical protein